MAAESEAESESGVDVIGTGRDLNWLKGGILFGLGVGLQGFFLILFEARGMHCIGARGWLDTMGEPLQEG